MNKPLRDDTQFTALFGALANGKRRRMLDLVKTSPGCSVNDLCSHFQMSRIAVMKHLNVLVEAGLVISKKSGRVRELYFNVAPIQIIYDRWSDEYSAFWATQAVDLKYAVEGRSQKSPRAGSNKKTDTTSSSRKKTGTTRSKKSSGKGKRK
ncbi:MAG: helix-turn-helix transcriptional regulator [Planctomycetota bacterium]